MKVIKFIFFLIILCFSICYINTYLSNDKNILNIILRIDKSSSKKNNNIITNLFKFINKKDGKNITSFLTFSKRNKTLPTINVIKEKVNPIIYIYNTHQTEEYAPTIYDISPSVMTVSNILEEELLTRNIISIVEDKSIKNELNKNNLVYSNSYRISRQFLEEMKKNYPSLIYFFDIHRDSIKRNLSVVEINNKNYAKVMFLIGQKNENYQKNLKKVKIMEEYLNNNYKGILRNTYFQPLYVYNQDVSDNAFLIEVGGQDNTLEEIYNSSVAISGAIEHLIEVDNEG